MIDKDQLEYEALQDDPQFQEIRDRMREEAEGLPVEQFEAFNSDFGAFVAGYRAKKREINSHADAELRELRERSRNGSTDAAQQLAERMGIVRDMERG